MPSLNFTVDSKLIEELGERLVSKPSIALAELVKNAFDADAHHVVIEFQPEDDIISVEDDGHGMTFDDFKYFWMRIGTTHKVGNTSPILGRNMTGSKGVGRLAVQLLASKLRLRTIPQTDDNGKTSGLEAQVDWRLAIEADELTAATVEYEIFNARDSNHGTKFILEGLKHNWSASDLKELAREIWYLQPPFRRPGDRPTEKERFEVQLNGAEEYQKEFQDQLDAIMEIQSARLVGEYRNGTARLAIEFWSAGSPYNTSIYSYDVKDAPHNDGHYIKDENLHQADFEVRIYRLSGRQPKGLMLDDVKSYMDRFSGVHVYDGGFRLPFYGQAQNDWLRLEYDHAHRLFVSQLLPESVDDAYRHTARLQYLPTLRRVFGVVQVDTAREPKLGIAISRDRLIETKAFEDLVYVIRYAFDRYAYDEALRQFEDSSRSQPTEAVLQSQNEVENILESYRSQIPQEIYLDLSSSVEKLVEDVERQQRESLSQVSLLSTLATAGVSAIAIQHELRKQFSWLQRSIERLTEIETGETSVQETIREITSDLREWYQRAKATNAIFDYMTGESIQERRRYKARTLVENIIEQLGYLSRGVEVDLEDIAPGLYLPEASYAEWGAIFQNVFTNAFNALHDTDLHQVKVHMDVRGPARSIVIQDTGVGIDLERSEDYFAPFVREIETTSERTVMGYGGTGLGLTIVRMLCQRIGCRVSFTEPEAGFSTAIAIEWREAKARKGHDAHQD